MAKIVNVHLHWESTRVVKMSCRNLSRRLDIRDWSILQSPFLNTALLLIFLVALGRNDFLRKQKYLLVRTLLFLCEIINT